MVLCHMVLKVPVARGDPKKLTETKADLDVYSLLSAKKQGGTCAFYIVKFPAKRRPLSIQSKAPSLHPAVLHECMKIMLGLVIFHMPTEPR